MGAGDMGAGELDGRLVAAVRAGDAEAVRALVEEGADPDALDTNGLPLLCAAVTAYDASVAEALVDGGADPDRVLPDGTTPLRRALDAGSQVVFSAVLGKEPRLRLPESDREQLLTLARSWYETGATEELRRRTGGSGSAVTVRVQDDEYTWVEQVSLGGLVVTPEDVFWSPGAKSALRTLLSDTDARVRMEACTAGMRADDLLPEVIQALLLLTEDSDPDVRGMAAAGLVCSRDRTPAVADALAALIDDDCQLVRLEAAYGLVVRDDPRCEKAIERVGSLGDGFEHDHRVDALWRWKWRKENPQAWPTAMEG